MKKLTRKVTCSICRKPRILTQYPENQAERKAMLEELSSVPYVCSDHPAGAAPQNPATPLPGPVKAVPVPIDLTQFDGITPGTWKRVGNQVRSDRNLAIVTARYAGTNEATAANVEACAAVPDLIAEVKRLREALTDLVGTLDAHETESLDCDRRGETYCDCLAKSKTKARAILPPVKPRIPKPTAT